jgi:rSAM-associated Gly-rich repeat protein
MSIHSRAGVLGFLLALAALTMPGATAAPMASDPQASVEVRLRRIAAAYRAHGGQVAGLGSEGFSSYGLSSQGGAEEASLLAAGFANARRGGWANAAGGGGFVNGHPYYGGGGGGFVNGGGGFVNARYGGGFVNGGGGGAFRNW